MSISYFIMSSVHTHLPKPIHTMLSLLHAHFYAKIFPVLHYAHITVFQDINMNKCLFYNKVGIICSFSMYSVHVFSNLVVAIVVDQI